MWSDGLTHKQWRWVKEYYKTGNATQSAIKAGYSKRTAKQIGCENLSKPYLRKALDKLREQEETADIMSANEVMQLITDIARGDEKEETVIYEDGEKVIKEVKPNMTSRLKAAEMLMKRYGMFNKRQEEEDTEVERLRRKLEDG